MNERPHMARATSRVTALAALVTMGLAMAVGAGSASGAGLVRADVPLPTGSISGRVTVPAGADSHWLDSVVVGYQSADGLLGDIGYPLNPDGTYTIDYLPEGDYKVMVEVRSHWDDAAGVYVPINLATEYYNDAKSFDTATVLRLADGEAKQGVDFVLGYGGSISGTITSPSYPLATLLPGAYAEVLNSLGDQVGRSNLDATGTYLVSGLPEGQYRVRFHAQSYRLWDPVNGPTDVDVNLVPEYYGGSRSGSTASTVSVTAGQTTTGINGVLEQGATVTGTVVPPAGAAADWKYYVEIHLHAADGEPYGEWIPIEDDGSFSVSGLPAGTYQLSADPLNWAPVADPQASTRKVTVGAPGTQTTGVTISLVDAVPAKVAAAELARLAELSQVASGVAPRCVDVAATYGVPSNATGVFFNVTAAEAQGPGNVVVYPDTLGNGATPPPNASTVNFEAGRDVANSAFVQLPPNGDVCTAVQGAKLGRLILDVGGYVTGNAGVSLLAAQRVVDTRSGAYHVGPIAGPVTTGQVKTVRIAGVGLIPENAVGVIANITVTSVSGPGHLKVWASDEARPNTSVVNYAPGQDKANGQYLALSGEGKINFESVASSADVIIDVTGYVTPESPMVPSTPTRVVETRASEGIIGPVPGRLANQQIYSVEIPTSVVPAGATSVVLNVTAVQPDNYGHLRVYPDTAGNGATPPPNTSSLNYIPRRDIPNMVVVEIPADRRINFYSVNATTDMVVDVIGYVEPTAP